jgi:hypothetical protein
MGLSDPLLTKNLVALEGTFELKFMKEHKSRDSSVSIATGYGLDSPGSIPGRGKIFLLHSIQIGSEALPASYPMDTEGDFLGGEVAGALS